MRHKSISGEGPTCSFYDFCVGLISGQSLPPTVGRSQPPSGSGGLRDWQFGKLDSYSSLEIQAQQIRRGKGRGHLCLGGGGMEGVHRHLPTVTSF